MPTTRAALLALSLALLLPLAGAAQADEEEKNFVERFLEGVTLGEGEYTTELIILPLLAAEDPERLEIQPSTWADKVGYHEPEFPKRRYNVGVANNETNPLLLLGGTVLGGGKRDRVVPSDVLVATGARVEIGTIPAAARSETRREALPFRLGSALAPPYIRERAAFHHSSTLVPHFVSHFLEFRNEGDERKSLSAINASERLNTLCLPCHQSLAAFPNAAEGRVIGAVIATRGRIRCIEMFGDNRLFKAWFQPLLKSHSFAAAALAAKAEKMNVPLPGRGDPEKALAEVREEAKKELERLREARFRDDDAPKGSIGTSLILRTRGGTRGTAKGWNGRLVHMAVFPHDPFEHALFSRPLTPPDEGDGYGGVSEEQLERKGRRGRLTEAERRLLERMRRRRSGRDGGLGNVR